MDEASDELIESNSLVFFQVPEVLFVAANDAKVRIRWKMDSRSKLPRLQFQDSQKMGWGMSLSFGERGLRSFVSKKQIRGKRF